MGVTNVRRSIPAAARLSGAIIGAIAGGGKGAAIGAGAGARAALAAIDWADQKNFWRLLPAGRRQSEAGELDNTPEAVEVWAANLQQRFGGRPIAVILEQSRGALVYMLTKYPHLVLFPVHPTTAARYRETFAPSGAKSDPSDTDSLLDLLLRHRERLRPLRPDTVESRLLHFLVEERRQTVDEKTRANLRLTDCLKLYFAQILRRFDDVTSPLVGDLLERWPTLEQLQRAHPGTLRRFFHEHNCRSEERNAERMAAIQQATSATQDPAVREAGVLIAHSLVAMLATLRTQIDVFDKRIAKLVADHPDGALFRSLPGAGDALVPRMIVAFGTQRDRYQSAYEMQCYSGIAPVIEASGNSQWVHFRFICPKFLRQTFHEFASCSIQQSEWARAYYDHLRHDKNKSHHVAVRSWYSNGCASSIAYRCRTANPMTTRSICSPCADAAGCLRESSGRPPTSGGSRWPASKDLLKLTLDGLAHKLRCSRGRGVDFTSRGRRCILSEIRDAKSPILVNLLQSGGRTMLLPGLFLRCCSGLLLLAGFALAQTGSTEITGLVTDATGAAVPGAAITITRVATKENRTAVTDNAGEYVFSLIEIGEYTVKCEKQGFKTRTLTGLTLQTAQKLRADLSLELGNVAESVEVRAGAVSLKTEDATVGQVIENRRIVELPLNGRNMSGLAVLVPGVQYGLRTGLADGSGGFPIPGAGVSVIANGIREVYNTVSLDGVDAKNPRTHITVFTPSIEAIEEFKVQASSYSAEYGQGGGARIEVSMKSGTNQLHGTAFEFLRNDKLDAEDYFLNLGTPAGTARAPKDRLRRNQFGAVISGPVVLPKYNGRNRTFWAFDYEGRRDTHESVQTAFFPPDTFRQGDFSALLTPPVVGGKPLRAPIVVFDPVTGDPFPNNILPAPRITNGAKNLMKLLPPAQFQQADPLDFTARSAVPSVIGQNQYFWRVDHNIGNNNRIFVRYAADRSTLTDNYINPNFPVYYSSRATNLASQWLHTFSQNKINEFRFGFNLADDDLATPRTDTNFDIDSLGIGPFRAISDGNRKLTPRETGVPLITQFTIGDRDTGNGLDRMKQLQFADNVSIHHDRHNFKMGGEFQRVDMNRASANNPRGALTFNANQGGYDFASLLMGYPASVISPEALHPTLPIANRWGAYFLDDWKVSSRLTVNLGLRWDYFGVPIDQDGAWRTLSFDNPYTAPNGTTIPSIIPVPIGAGGAIKLWNQEERFFMPRVGLAYRPGNKWVIRSGAGWFADVEHLNTFTILANMPPFGSSQQFDAVTDPGKTVAVTANQTNYNIATRQFRPGSPIVSFDNPFGGSLRTGPSNLLYIPSNHRSPNQWQWSLDVQRELPLSTALTVGYVGSKSSNVGNTVANFNSPDPSSDTNFQRRRPLQQFYDDGRVQDLGGLRLIDSYGNGSYHGLQTSLEKRFSHGLVYGFSYTFSKAMGDGEAGGNEDGNFQDPRNRASSRGRYQFDQTHSAVFHFVYELPLGRGLHGAPGYLIKGWQVNGILSLRSGFPFTVTQSADLNTGGTPIRPDRIASGSLGDNANRQLWFDPTAFRRVSCNIPSRPDLCHYGDSGKAIFDTPGQRNLDFSLYKNFQVRENTRLQFRSEFFNFTNTPYFGAPNGISFQNINSLVPDGPRNGEIRSLRTPMRIVQFSLKLSF